MNLGIVELPLERVVGTKTHARGSAFSKSFYPIMGIETEFADKWMHLLKAHMEEGIRDAVKVYEYMGYFFVEEGNKRVSVLKCLKATSVLGDVIRIMPARSNTLENRLYYEFVDFYRLSNMYGIEFSQLGSFGKLQRLVGKKPDEQWNDEERLELRSLYARFESCYAKEEAEQAPKKVGDAFLQFLTLYPYQELTQMEIMDLQKIIVQSVDELKLKGMPSLLMEPGMLPEKKRHLFSHIFGEDKKIVKVAFVHEKTMADSGWSYGHELGRRHLEENFADEVQTTCYEGVTEENAEEILQQAVADGMEVIFTTAPTLLKASLRVALQYPNVKILNCSLNSSHKSIRTYYARMYEAKFLMGAIAGAMSENGKLGYVADYPIYGMIANINAFALGAKMVNPRAKVYLEWSTKKDHDYNETFKRENIFWISGQDMIIPQKPTRTFGVYWADEKQPRNLAMPIWHWGKFYEQLLKQILSGAWKMDEEIDESKGVNYWWGMSSGVIDVVYSKHLPIGTVRMVELLKKNIQSGDFNPFSGVMYSQTGIVQSDEQKSYSPEEIMTMDWLAENVVGEIPAMEELVDRAKSVVRMQGIDINE